MLERLLTSSTDSPFYVLNLRSAVIALGRALEILMTRPDNLAVGVYRPPTAKKSNEGFGGNKCAIRTQWHMDRRIKFQ